MMQYYGDYGYGHYGLGLLGTGLSVLFWVLIAMLIMRIIRSGAFHGGPRKDWHDRMGGSKTALDVLKERYAKGEINKVEFEEKKKDISM